MCYGGIYNTVTLTKGCPQGSIFGPILWNATMNQLLTSNPPDFIRIQANADDIAVSVAANTRTQLVERATNILATVKLWGSKRGLNFSTSKSTTVPLGCNLFPGFTIPFRADRIVTKPSAKYLGIWIDQHLTFMKHINIVRSG